MKMYEEIKIEFILLNTEDIITTSPAGNDNGFNGDHIEIDVNNNNDSGISGGASN